MSEAQQVREALFDDPFVSNEDYGRLVEEAAQSDAARALGSERDEPEGPLGVAGFLSGRYV